MCRLFGLVSAGETPAEPWLVSGERSFLAQSNASPEHAQRDGWGIAWYPSRRTPKIEKGVGGAFAQGEEERFRAAAHLATGPVVVGHLRHASNPMNLPLERLMGLENAQPFHHGGILFAHNGLIRFPRETRPLLGKFEEKVEGVNDSEVLFWLLVKHTEETGDPLGAYTRTVEDLVKVWHQRGSPEEGPYSGLNVLFSRGPGELWAFCHWRGEHGGALLDDSRPYYRMTYKADTKTAIVGSEPFDTRRHDWRDVDNGQYLHVQEAHGLVGVKTGRIPLPEVVPAPSAPR